MIQHILLAIDGSASAEKATDFAASLALRYRAKVTVLHAFVPSVEHVGIWNHNLALHRTLDESRKCIALTAKRLGEMGITQVETDVTEGPATNVILGAAETYKPDLIVIGARGQSTWPGSILGSVSTAVTQRAECPVLVVR